MAFDNYDWMAVEEIAEGISTYEMNDSEIAAQAFDNQRIIAKALLDIREKLQALESKEGE